MKNIITNEELFKAIKNIEHPEISKTLPELGMILDVSVNKNIANVAMAIPKFDIPDAVKQALKESIKYSVENLGLKLNVDFFEMLPENREKFLALARANWKGSI